MRNADLSALQGVAAAIGACGAAADDVSESSRGTNSLAMAIKPLLGNLADVFAVFRLCYIALGPRGEWV